MLVFKNTKPFLLILLTLLTLVTSLVSPNFLNLTAVAKENSSALILEEEGKKLYDQGSFAEAAKFWQKAADAYGANEDDKKRNLINKAKALQSLGLYPEACNQLLSTLIGLNLSCAELNESNIKKITEQPTSLNEVIGLQLLGDLLQKLGDLKDATTVLQESVIVAEKYPEVKGGILLSLGNSYRAEGNKSRYESSYQDIVDALDGKYKQVLELCQQPDTHYKDDNNTILAALKIYNQASDCYQKAAKSSTPLTRVQAKLNQLSLLVEMQTWWSEQINLRLRATKIEMIQMRLNRVDITDSLNTQISQLIPEIKSDLDVLIQSGEVSREIIYAQINFTHYLLRFNSNNPTSYFSVSEIAKILVAAIQQARSLGNGDKQAESEALGTLAHVYETQVLSTANLTEEEQQYLVDAKGLTEQALNLVADISTDNRQLLYRHRHLSGRILKAQNNLEAAIVAYNEAWKIVESLRKDLVTNVDNQFSFRQNVEPVYREYIDLLLQAQDSTIDFKKLGLLNHITEISNLKAQKQQKKELDNPLYIARIVMASLQLAELDNFFKQPCSPPIGQQEDIASFVDKVNAQVNNKSNDKVNNQTAVIYPIILNNSLEVLLYQNGKSYRHSIALKQQEVKNTLEDLANIIYNHAIVEPNSASNINDFQEDEDKPVSAINCDIKNIWLGELDKASALYCNEERIKIISQKVYSWLIKPWKSQLEKAQIKTLVFVLDRPFQSIPIAALYDGKNYLVEQYNIVINVLGQQLIDPKPIQSEELKILAAGVSEGRSEPVKGEKFGELKKVKDELDSIKELKPSTKILLNKQFTKKNFQAELKSFPTIVHLATHGIFSSNREKTFILTGDSSIDIDEFQDLLNPQGKLKSRAIALLVLSACETASGDDKAALGIAGVVLRSGANSTIASLWPVSDPATAELMKAFYQNLITKGMSRAAALSEAQRSLLKGEYKHPFYWASFILLGNWL